ncbi:MAG TPA: transposase, partial [Longimicrobiaceae bacterium]|nr:transposase [Longimicrobiaceae bacterium]
SQALLGAYREVRAAVRSGTAANVDETGWRLRKERRWVWVAVTAGATHFRSSSGRGLRIVERFLTVGETCRQRGVGLLDYLTRHRGSPRRLSLTSPAGSPLNAYLPDNHSVGENAPILNVIGNAPARQHSP